MGYSNVFSITHTVIFRCSVTYKNCPQNPLTWYASQSWFQDSSSLLLMMIEEAGKWLTVCPRCFNEKINQTRSKCWSKTASSLEGPLTHCKTGDPTTSPPGGHSNVLADKDWSTSNAAKWAPLLWCDQAQSTSYPINTSGQALDRCTDHE